MDHTPGLMERMALIERDHPFRFNLVLIGSIAAVWMVFDFRTGLIFLGAGLAARFWFFRPGGIGQRIRARHYGWDRS